MTRPFLSPLLELVADRCWVLSHAERLRVLDIVDQRGEMTVQELAESGRRSTADRVSSPRSAA